MATSSSSSIDSEGGSSRRGGKHRGREERERGTSKGEQHTGRHSDKARPRSISRDRDRQKRHQQQHDHHKRRSRSRSHSRHRSGDARDSHRRHSRDDRDRHGSREHRSSSSRREAHEDQQHGYRHHRSRSRDRSRDRKRRRGDRSRSNSRSRRRADRSRSSSRGQGPGRGPDFHHQHHQQQQRSSPRSRGGIGFGGVPPTAAARHVAAEGEDPAASIPGYAQMSALEKLKARTRLALQKADVTAAAKAAAAELEEAEKGGGGDGSRRPWTRFVFDKHAELDEDAADRQQHLDAAVGMGGVNSLQSLAGGIGLTGGDLGVFDRDDVELAAGQGSFLGGAAQQRQRLQEAAHEAAIFGAPVAAGGAAVAGGSSQVGRRSNTAGLGAALHHDGSRPAGDHHGVAVWDAGHGQGLGDTGDRSVGAVDDAVDHAAGGAGSTAGALLCEQVVAQKPLSWRERAALKRAGQ